MLQTLLEDGDHFGRQAGDFDTPFFHQGHLLIVVVIAGLEADRTFVILFGDVEEIPPSDRNGDRGKPCPGFAARCNDWDVGRPPSAIPSQPCWRWSGNCRSRSIPRGDRQHSLWRCTSARRIPGVAACRRLPALPSALPGFSP